MNEFVYLAEAWSDRGRNNDDLLTTSLQLAEVPCSPLGKSHISPDRALAALVDQWRAGEVTSRSPPLPRVTTAQPEPEITGWLDPNTVRNRRPLRRPHRRRGRVEESIARSTVELALEQAVAAGALVVGGRGWRTRQQDITEQTHDSDHPSQPGQTLRTVITTERIGTWIDEARRGALSSSVDFDHASAIGCSTRSNHRPMWVSGWDRSPGSWNDSVTNRL